MVVYYYTPSHTTPAVYLSSFLPEPLIYLFTNLMRLSANNLPSLPHFEDIVPSTLLLLSLS